MSMPQTVILKPINGTFAAAILLITPPRADRGAGNARFLRRDPDSPLSIFASDAFERTVKGASSFQVN